MTLLVGSIFHMTRKIVSEMTYNVSMGTLNPTILIPYYYECIFIYWISVYDFMIVMLNSFVGLFMYVSFSISYIPAVLYPSSSVATSNQWCWSGVRGNINKLLLIVVMCSILLLHILWSDLQVNQIGFFCCPSVLDTVGWVIWPVKIVPNMTYNVFGGTLNPTLVLYSSLTGSISLIFLKAVAWVCYCNKVIWVWWDQSLVD